MEEGAVKGCADPDVGDFVEIDEEDGRGVEFGDFGEAWECENMGEYDIAELGDFPGCPAELPLALDSCLEATLGIFKPAVAAARVGCCCCCCVALAPGVP